MLRFRSFCRVGLLVAIFTASVFLFCTSDSNPVDTGGSYGTIEIRARVVNSSLAKGMASDGLAAINQTAADRIVVEIGGGGDAAPIRIERRLDLSRPTVIDTVTKVPVGRNQRVTVWAEDANGVITHIDSVESRTVNVEAGSITPIFATLIPAAGSIYLQLVELPTNTTVHATFTALDGTIVAESIVNRAVRTFVSLDNIPHLTTGVLRVVIVDNQGEIIYIATSDLTFNARSDNTVDLRFSDNSGSFAVDATVYEPGVTIGSYNFKDSESTIVETGELIITEIMWNASNENYIELYNPSDAVLTFDVLTVDVNGTANNFSNVEIAAHGYFVIGRHDQPHVDAHTPTTSGLAIVSTNNSGNWITVKHGNGTIIDRVIFATGSFSGNVGWPTLSGRRSIELMRDKYCVTENNYGKNWKVTDGGLIAGTTNMYGTPGR